MKVVLYFYLFIMLASGNVLADKYTISVQPILPPERIEQDYSALAEYLSEKTGHEFVIKSYRNFLTYWVLMKHAREMDFVLDAAHFTDYRVQKMSFRVLVKIPETVSFSIVTSDDNLIFDMDELIAKKIATMPSPGLGAVRLNAMFPNPVRLPVFIQASDSLDAVSRVMSGEVDAAIIPTPLVGNFDSLNTVTTTESVPHMALSVSPRVDESVVRQVKKALLEAKDNEAGRKMLARLKIDMFENAVDKQYKGYAGLLDGVFGY